MITITGATGQLGSGIIENLLQKGMTPSTINALARTAEKAENFRQKGLRVSIGDYNDYASLVHAFKGSDTVLLISGNDMENRSKQQLDVVNAAKEAGVQHMLYTSVQRKTDSTDSPIRFVLNSHMETEQAIKNSGMSYTLLRNNLYMEMLPWVLGQNVFETGIFYPAGEGKIAYTLRSDMAEAIANILLSKPNTNREYNISNSHSLGFDEIAAHLSNISGKTVHYVSPTVEIYKSTLMGAGVPEMAVDMMAGFAQGAQNGELAAGNTDLPALLGREPVSFKTFLNSMYALETENTPH